MYTREDMLSAMHLIADGAVDAEPLVTKTMPLEQAADAFAAADAGGEIKVQPLGLTSLLPHVREKGRG